MFAHLLAFAGYLCIPWLHFPRGSQLECNLILLPTGKYTRTISFHPCIFASVSMYPCIPVSLLPWIPASCTSDGWGFAHLFALFGVAEHSLPRNMIKYFVMRLRNPYSHRKAEWDGWANWNCQVCSVCGSSHFQVPRKFVSLRMSSRVRVCVSGIS